MSIMLGWQHNAIGHAVGESTKKQKEGAATGDAREIMEQYFFSFLIFSLR
jgi:hypothetical protein